MPHGTMRVETRGSGHISLGTEPVISLFPSKRKISRGIEQIDCQVRLSESKSKVSLQQYLRSRFRFPSSVGIEPRRSFRLSCSVTDKQSVRRELRRGQHHDKIIRAHLGWYIRRVRLAQFQWKSSTRVQCPLRNRIRIANELRRGYIVTGSSRIELTDLLPIPHLAWDLAWQRISVAKEFI